MWRFPCTELQFSFVRPLKKCWKCCGETKVLRNLLQDDKKPLFELYLSWGKMLVVHNHPLVVIPSQHTQTHNLKTTPDWPMSTHWLIKHDAASWHHYITGNKPLLLYFRPGSIHLHFWKVSAKHSRSTVVPPEDFSPLQAGGRQPISHNVPQPFRHGSHWIDILPESRVAVSDGGFQRHLEKNQMVESIVKKAPLVKSKNNLSPSHCWGCKSHLRRRWFQDKMRMPEFFQEGERFL